MHEGSNLPAAHVTAGFVLSLAVASVGLVLNSLTLFTLTTSSRLRQHPTNYFLVSLTVSDLLYCAVCLPVTADTFARCGICAWHLACSTYAFLFYWNLLAMMLNQAAVAFNRFVSVCRPTDPPFQFSHRNNLFLILLTWSVPFAVFLLPLTDTWGSMGFDPGTGTCTFREGTEGASPRVLFFVFGLGIPTVIIMFCYARIYVTFKKSSGRVKKTSTPIMTAPPPSVAITPTHQASPGCGGGQTTLLLQPPPLHLEPPTSTGGQQQSGGCCNNLTLQVPNGESYHGGRRRSMGAELLRVALLRGNPNSSPEGSDGGGGGRLGLFSSSQQYLASKVDLGRRRYSEAVVLSIREREQRRERNEQRMTLTLFAISVAYLACTLPPAIILTIDPSAESFPSWHVPLYFFGWAFGVINPFIYFAFNQIYREEYIKTVTAARDRVLKLLKPSCCRSLSCKRRCCSCCSDDKARSTEIIQL